MQHKIDTDILKLIPGTSSSMAAKRPHIGPPSTSSRKKAQQFFSEKQHGLSVHVNTIETARNQDDVAGIKKSQTYYLQKAQDTTTGTWVEGPSFANPIIPALPTF